MKNLLISITYFQVKNLWKLPTFLRYASRSSAQAKIASGILHQDIKADFWKLRFWTLTAWESEEAMLTYIRQGAHLQAMKRSRSLAKEMKATRYPATKIPTWSEAMAKVAEEKPIAV